MAWGIESFVYLDGKFVRPEAIAADKHRFLGMFRPPTDPFDGAKTDCLCGCGAILRYVGESQKHWMQGCHDTPQYVSIGVEGDRGRIG
jgi:hypothetical protein